MFYCNLIFFLQVTVPGSSTSFVLTDLEEFQEYTFRMVASNDNGQGIFADEVVGYTLSDTPSDVPQNFTLETTSSTVSTMYNVRIIAKIRQLEKAKINPLPDNKILDRSKLKHIAEDIFKCISNEK